MKRKSLGDKAGDRVTARDWRGNAPVKSAGRYPAWPGHGEPAAKGVVQRGRPTKSSSKRLEAQALEAGVERLAADAEHRRDAALVAASLRVRRKNLSALVGQGRMSVGRLL